MTNPSTLDLSILDPMPRAARATRTHSALIGASLGMALFLPVALLPSLYFGGAAGVGLASGLFGVENASAFSLDTVIVLGIVSGVTLVASLFALLGAVLGGSVGALTDAVRSRRGRDQATLAA